MEPTLAGTYNFVVRLQDEDNKINLYSFDIEIANGAQDEIDQTKTIIEIKEAEEAPDLSFLDFVK